MSEHTPGPWSLSANGAAWNLFSPDRTDHFCILIGMVHNNEGEHAANALLIASAPDLLEACRKALTCASIDTSVAHVIRLAIAKATATDPGRH